MTKQLNIYLQNRHLRLFVYQSNHCLWKCFKVIFYGSVVSRLMLVAARNVITKSKFIVG